MTTENSETPENAWGEPVEDEKDDHFNVPEEERKDHDQDVGSYSLGTTGDDVDLANRERQAYVRSEEDEARIEAEAAAAAEEEE